MARTRNQASAGRTESAQRSRTINGGEGGRFDTRFDTTVGGTKDGEEASSSSGSDRERRAARRRMAVSQKASEATTGEEGVQATAEETVNEGNAGATKE